MDRRLKLAVNNRSKPNIKDYRDSVRFVSLADAHNDPQIVEVRGGNDEKFVLYGEKNDYYDNLILRYLGSPTNNRCIQGIADMIYGKGLESTDDLSDKATFKMHLEMKRLFNPHELRRVTQDLKQLGEGFAQIIWNKKKNRILKFIHTPRECWRAEKASNGVITGYYYHPKWKDYQHGDKLKRVPTYGHGTPKEQIELYVFRPYRSGFYYYSPVDYHGCLQYCELEEEVSNYHLSNVAQGMQPSMIINFNNGVPPESIQEDIERKIQDKFSGTGNAGKFILAFNDDVDTQASIEPIHLPDAHAQYQFLSDESREKIMLGHGVVSPILLGIKDNTGFGNNAEELRTASILMDNMVIRPFQNIMLDGINQLLKVNDVTLNTYFVTLQPIEFTSTEKIATKIKREEETGEKLTAHDTAHDAAQDEVTELHDDEGDEILGQLEGLGETIDLDQWEVIYSEVVKDADTPFTMPENLAEANPNEKSWQDQGIFKVRYAYSPVRNSADSRRFCKHMERFTAANTVFRKEDIDMMSFRGVNHELGHKKRNYSLFKYKGGVNCHHYWEVRVYKKKVAKGTEVDESNISPLNNPEEVPIRPIDMPNKGAYPSAFKKDKK